jgi:hypothetical protein
LDEEYKLTHQNAIAEIIFIIKDGGGSAFVEFLCQLSVLCPFLPIKEGERELRA